MNLNAKIYRFLRDESGGERDMMTTLLILAVIVLPIIIVLISYGDQVVERVKTSWNNIMNAEQIGSD